MKPRDNNTSSTATTTTHDTARRGRPPGATLAQAHPDIAAQLVDQSLANRLARGTDQRVEWECDLGHRWIASVFNRTNAKNPTGCAVCSGKQILQGFNDLATTHPDIAAMCVNPQDATTVAAFSSKKIEFQCQVNAAHQWTAPVSRLTDQKSRCPYCSSRLPVIGENDLSTTHPVIAAQLDDPSEAQRVKASSKRKMQWRCPTDQKHTWTTSPYERTRKRKIIDCPECPQQTAQSPNPQPSSISATQPVARTVTQHAAPTPTVKHPPIKGNIGFDDRTWLTVEEWQTYRKRLPVRYLSRIKPLILQRDQGLCSYCQLSESEDRPMQLAHRIGFHVGVLQWGLTPDWLDHPENITLAHRGLCNNSMELNDNQIYNLLVELGKNPAHNSPVTQRRKP